MAADEVQRPDRLDLRLPLLAAAAWLGALAVLAADRAQPWVWALSLVALLVGLGVGLRDRDVRRLLVASVLTASAAATVAHVQTTPARFAPMDELTSSRASISGQLQVSGDPRLRSGRFADFVVVRGTLTQVRGRGQQWRVSVPVVVMGEPDLVSVPLGATVALSGRLAPAEGDAVALLSVRGGWRVVAQPDPWWRAAALVRSAIRRSVEDRAPDQAALVPALVDGDDADLDPSVVEQFRTTGLTHLTAVSGTNLTLVVGFLLVLARWFGVRGRWLQVVAVAGIAGFILLARTEPSVVRAAAMGTVGLVAMSSNGRGRGSRSLGVAVTVLLLVDPHLAMTPGFALSVLATAGILLFAPVWRDAMAQWLPRWGAEALAVPLAAQIACTPVVAALSGQVSLVAVGANLLAAPAVAPATVLGLAGGVVGLLWPALGAVVAWPAAWSVGWILTVARVGSQLPTAAIDWSTTTPALVALTALMALIVLVAPRVLGSASATLCSGVVMAAIIVVRPPSLATHDWAIVACDVGQGDALLLNAGSGNAVVVDAGPDPGLIDQCLRRYRVDRVPLVVLTHFHADHVDGISGILRDRPVGQIYTTSLGEPASGLGVVTEAVAEVDRRPLVSPYGVGQRVGDVRLQQLWPRPGVSTATEGSAANNASVVLLAEVQGLRVLLTGDIEPEAQTALAREVGAPAIDVLKVPHHGSRHQNLDWLVSLRASLALISVGQDNDYGHPAPDVVAALEGAHIDVARTDVGGDLVVQSVAGQPRLADD